MQCAICAKELWGDDYLEIVFKGSVIGYLCKSCDQDKRLSEREAVAKLTNAFKSASRRNTNKE